MGEKMIINVTDFSEEEKRAILDFIEERKMKKNKKNAFTPERGEKYYFIDDCGKIEYTRNASPWHENKFEFGNCFRTKEETEIMIEKLKIHRELQLFADKHNEGEIDWTKTKEKYEITLFNTIDGDKHIRVDSVTHTQRANTVYFSSRDIAEKAIKHVREKKLLDYYFG